MILDRTGSMNGVDTANARAAADSVRKEYDPRLQWIGLSLLHRSKTVDEWFRRSRSTLGPSVEW